MKYEVDDIAELLKSQISQFFKLYKEFEPYKWVEIDGCEGYSETRQEILTHDNRFLVTSEQ